MTKPDPVAVSPAVGPLPAIYVPPPGQPGPAGLLGRAAARVARLVLAVGHPPAEEERCPTSPLTVVTNAQVFTLYSFAPDTATTSKCTGACAQIWAPVNAPATPGQGVTGKLGTITRSDGSKQATYDGHPLYTYTADTAPGQAKGNGINIDGGVWREVTASGQTAPAGGGSGGGSYGY